MANRSGRVRPVVGAVAFLLLSQVNAFVSRVASEHGQKGGVECSQAKGNVGPEIYCFN